MAASTSASTAMVTKQKPRRLVVGTEEAWPCVPPDTTVWNTGKYTSVTGPKRLKWSTTSASVTWGGTALMKMRQEPATPGAGGAEARRAAVDAARSTEDGSAWAAP